MSLQRPHRRRAARVCGLLALLGVLVAMAAPEIGTGRASRDGVVELVLDVSGSTNATDLAPTRLGAMQAATERFVDQLSPEVRVGVVSFSGTVAVASPPTTDREALRAAIRKLAGEGPTAMGDALQFAARDRPETVVLVSDGSNTQGAAPLEVAKRLASQRVTVHTIALGTPDATIQVPDEAGAVHRIPVPPDPYTLSLIAQLTGGRFAPARSNAGLDAAMRDVAAHSGLLPGSRELAPWLLAVALALLLVADALPGAPAAPIPAWWRLVPAVPLALIAATLAWFGPGSSAQAPSPELSAAPAAVPAVPPPSSTTLPKPTRFPNVTDFGARDRRLVKQAVALLRQEHELVSQAPAGARPRRGRDIESLSIQPCDFCADDSLSQGDGSLGANGSCAFFLNTPVIRRAATSWGVPPTRLTAAVFLHEQEVCLRGPATTRRTPALDAERRLARKLSDDRLLDAVYVQLDGSRRNREIVQQAVAFLHRHGQLAPQLAVDIRRHRLNEVERLSITACDRCSTDDLGQANVGGKDGRVVLRCDILLNIPQLGLQARDWGLGLIETVASTLTHEQEHCVRDPDDRETPAIDAQLRLARKVGGSRLIEMTQSRYGMLDATGHWKD